MDENTDKNPDNNIDKNTNKITRKNQGKIRGHHIFSNTPGLGKDFVDFCLEEISKDGYQGTSLKSTSWNNIMVKLNAKYEGASLDQKALKNRWDHLKKKYMIWRELINKSGHGYNAATGIFDWPDSVWDDVLKRTPEAKQFRYKKLEFSEELTNMYEGTFATGEFAATVLTDDGDDGEENFNEYMQDPYFEGVSFTPNQSDVRTTPIGDQTRSSDIGTSSTSSKKRKTRARTPDAEVQELIELLKSQHEYIVNEREEKKTEKAAEKLFSVGECVKMLNAMKTYLPITPTLIQLAIVKFAEKVEYRKAFMELDEDEKLIFLNGITQL